MLLKIDFEATKFPAKSPLKNGHHILSVTWEDILWSAISVGRPSVHSIFKHGDVSEFEAIFRLSLVRMALEQRSSKSKRLRRTDAFKELDPSERGAINYFLGLTMAKLVADKQLGAPYLLHLDVFGKQLKAVLKQRSRPDLVGQTSSGDWIALESKGRSSAPNNSSKNKAKQQAQRITTIQGHVPKYTVASFSFFDGDALKIYWEDPKPKARDEIEVSFPASAWRLHYLPLLRLIQRNRAALRAMRDNGQLMAVEGADISVGIHPSVLRRLIDLPETDPRPTTDHKIGDPFRRDGIAVITGASWKSPLIR
jgi:hypothetical protein